MVRFAGGDIDCAVRVDANVLTVRSLTMLGLVSVTALRASQVVSFTGGEIDCAVGVRW